MANSINIGNKKALLIAVQSVKGEGFSLLRHAHEDAKSLRSLLIEKFDYPEANIVLMMHDNELPNHLWPARKNILEQITKMVSGASANDQFFFYYSGHGCQITCEHHTETDGKDEAIYAYTGRHIIDNTLKKRLVKPLPRGSQLFALFDSCHSDTILDLDHHKCNKLHSGGTGTGTRRKSLTDFFFPDRVSRPKTLPTDQQPPPRGRTGNPSLTLNSVLIRPHSPTSWLPHMFVDSPPSALRRVLSPDSWINKCTGNCPKPEEQQEAHVVSLSACRDNENAYDDNETGGTMTKFFIECVSQDPKPSLLTLLKHIKDRVDQMNKKRHVDQANERPQLQLKVIERRSTDLVDKMKEGRKKQILRRNTEVVIHDLDEYMSSMKGRSLPKARNNWQNPGVEILFPFLSSCLTSVTTVCQPLPIRHGSASGRYLLTILLIQSYGKTISAYSLLYYVAGLDG